MSEPAHAAPLYYSHPACLEHDPRAHIPRHPDTPERLLAIERALDDAGWLGWERRRAPAAAVDQLELIHSARLVRMIEELSLAGGGAIDPDTSVGEPSYRAALHAAGGACEMTRALLAGDARAGFCAVRPSGHHAEPDRAMGFCLFNNVAVAAELAIRELDAQPRVHPRLGRPPRQRHRRGVPPPRRCPVREHPSVRHLPRQRAARRRRLRPRRGLHAQPARSRRL